MPATILTNAKIHVGGYNLSGFHNSLDVSFGPEMLDDTVFGTNGTRSNKPGLKTLSVEGSGFWDSDVDLALYSKIGAVREVLSVAPVGAAEGDVAMTTRAVSGTYAPVSGEVGALMPFNLSFQNAASPLVRGVVLATGSKATTGNGSAQLLGLLASGKRAYSGLHVTAIAATSIVVIVESDDTGGFASPTTRLTHTTFLGAGTVGSDWQELAGPVATDTYWRSKWTIVGGPFTIHHVFGIQ